MRAIFTMKSGYSVICDFWGSCDFVTLDETRIRGNNFMRSPKRLGWGHYPEFGLKGSYLAPDDDKQAANEEADLVGWEEEDGEIVYHLGTIDYVPEGCRIINPWKDFTDRFYNDDLHFRLPKDRKFIDKVHFIGVVGFKVRDKYVFSLGDGTYVDFRKDGGNRDYQGR